MMSIRCAMSAVRRWLRSEVVLVVAWVLAAVSAVVMPPDAAYGGYIDTHTLGLLFSLMVVMAGLESLGVFRTIAQALVRVARTSRQLDVVLVLLCFVSSMIITNDVALITFVPLGLKVLRIAGRIEHAPFVVAMQTVAANLGSMMTPIGNPQNLYLYTRFGLTPQQLVEVMMPYGLASFGIIALLVGVRASKPVSLEATGHHWPQEPGKIIVYCILFALSLAALAHVVVVWVPVVVCLVWTLMTDRHVLRRVDFALLLTFVGFFILIGNVGRIPACSSFVSSVIQGHVVLTGVAASQVISNVPAALLLSGFSSDWAGLLVGVNLGGLGTLIASMASLISYKCVARELPHDKGRYLAVFSILNIGLLVVLCGMAYLLGA